MFEIYNYYFYWFNVENVGIIGEDSGEIDVMEWMINTQLGRRNLPPAQRLTVMNKFKKKIQEQAKNNQSMGGGDKKSEYRVSPNGEKRSQIKQTHTDKELAKLAGVGTGTVARFNKVMNSDDEGMTIRLNDLVTRYNWNPHFRKL